MLKNQDSIHLKKEIKQEVVDGFEGPEKKLRVQFKYNVEENSEVKISKLGLRQVNQEKWSNLLKHVKCSILSKTSNEHFDSYVLSESSLFVYPNEIVLKTCGTTTLLKCIEPLLKLVEGLSMIPIFIFFSRKNYVFPHKQLSPHLGFKHEVKFLDNYFDGKGFVLGSLNSDHWYCYIADYRDEDEILDNKPHFQLEIMMHDLCQEKMKHFVKNKKFKSTKDSTLRSGINDLILNSTIDSYSFDPCGYSMNGLNGKSFSTIHVTPENHCSFVSYETNISEQDLLDSSNKTYSDLVQDVIDVFKPGRFTVSIFADEHSIKNESTHSIFKPRNFIKNNKNYKFESNTFYDFNKPYNASLSQFKVKE